MAINQSVQCRLNQADSRIRNLVPSRVSLAYEFNTFEIGEKFYLLARKYNPAYRSLPPQLSVGEMGRFVGSYNNRNCGFFRRQFFKKYSLPDHLEGILLGSHFETYIAIKMSKVEKPGAN